MCTIDEDVLIPLPFLDTMHRSFALLFALLFVGLLATGCSTPVPSDTSESVALRAQMGDDETIQIYRSGDTEPILTQNAASDFRPYLHPIQTPDGNASFTQFSPGHHRHQTGLYWGFTQVNGRDYFHHPEGDYWRRVSAEVVTAEGETVVWQTVYDMLDEAGNAMMTETQRWTMVVTDSVYTLDLDWSGTAHTDVIIGEYDYGGLFLRMPWHEEIEGAVVNTARQYNAEAEGQRAMWLDVGMAIEGLDEWGHVAIFDHPENAGYPQPWRVDGQMGVGPVRARLGDWSILEGQTETIQHRLLFYTGELDDMWLNQAWGAFTGQDGMYALASLWDLARAEGHQAEFLTPTRAAESMTLPEGYEVNAWAGEPMLTQPMAFAWDDRGRLWIAENRDYESRGTGFSASGDSRILILEDTDGDGEADSRKVFLEGIPFPAAIAVGFDGLFLGAPPHLMFIPDRDQDDMADRDDIEIRLTGWGIRDRHETINSLHWGPDGWLYGLEGFATPSKIRKPNGNDRLLYQHNDPFPDDLLEQEGVDINGGVWRYHPVKDRFEAVAHGFSNPWGIDHDAKGQLFISACVIPHVFHIIPGGIYQRQGGRHFNPYVYSDIQHIVDHRHRSAHGGARVYQSDAFPAEQQGRLFMANIHEHAVLTDVLEPKGSGFVARHGEDFMKANNAQWIGFSLEIGPDGAVYVLDWHDADICGTDVLDKDTGRIFRIAPTESRAENWDGRYADLNTQSDLQLVELQQSPSDWHTRRARVILQYRATQRALDADALAALQAMFADESNPDVRLKALWALHITNNISADQLLAALDDTDEYVRAWAIQLLTEDLEPREAAVTRFAQIARWDRSPVVRKYLAAALQRMGSEARWMVASDLVTRGEDAEDHNIPKLIWFGMEALVAENPERALELARVSEVPMVTEFIGRRLVDASALDPLLAGVEQMRSVRLPLLRGMRAGLEGRSDLETPAGWSDVYASLQRDSEVAALALEIAQRFGDAEAVKNMLASLADGSASLDERRTAINGLASHRESDLVPYLPRLMDEAALRVETIRAIAAFEEEALGQLLLDRFASFSATEKAEALQTLASRPVYGWALTQAIQAETIDRREVPAYIARQLRRVVGNGFVEVWGPIDELGIRDEAVYARYRALLTEPALAAANSSAGREIFQRTCGACHMMYGEGGRVGPDITGSNRDNLDYILSNILYPSEEIQDDYRMVAITTHDGRTYLGNISAETEQQVTLRLVGQDALVINRSDIESLEVTTASLMPEGLLEPLTDQDVLDLIAYLRTTEQVALPLD